MPKSSYKVSVIIPVFNVQMFIERCAMSLFEQTLKDVEYIFVDDASPDGSIGILNKCLAKYPELEANVRIVRHECNKGLPSARNTGLHMASGEYVFHCDGDDYVEKDMLEVMYAEASAHDADIVWCDWYLSFRENERYMRQKEYSDADGFLHGMLSGTLKYNVWNKLARRTLYTENNILFPDGHPMGEDMTMIRLAACAKSVAYVNRAFYHYVKLNPNAYTAHLTETQLADIEYNVDETIAFLQKNVNEDLSEDVMYFKQNVKLPFIISSDMKDYQRWQKWYPESNHLIMHNDDISLRTRILQYMAWKKQYWYLKVYYYAVVKFVYGFLYK